MADLQMFVPLFLTAEVDPKIIDTLLAVSPKTFDEIDESGDGRNTAEFVIMSDPVQDKLSTLKGQAQGTRPPTSRINSPYLDSSEEDLTSLFLEHLDDLTPNWSASVFAIADSITAKGSKSVLLVYPALKGKTPAEGREPESVRIDFQDVLNWAVQINVGNASVAELKDCVGQDGIVTARSVEEARARGEAP